MYKWVVSIGTICTQFSAKTSEHNEWLRHARDRAVAVECIYWLTQRSVDHQSCSSIKESTGPSPTSRFPVCHTDIIQDKSFDNPELFPINIAAVVIVIYKGCCLKLTFRQADFRAEPYEYSALPEHIASIL